MNADEFAALRRALGYALAELQLALEMLDAPRGPVWPDPRPDPDIEPAEPWARRGEA